MLKSRRVLLLSDEDPASRIHQIAKTAGGKEHPLHGVGLHKLAQSKELCFLQDLFPRHPEGGAVERPARPEVLQDEGERSRVAVEEEVAVEVSPSRVRQGGACGIHRGGKDAVRVA